MRARNFNTRFNSKNHSQLHLGSLNIFRNQDIALLSSMKSKNYMYNIQRSKYNAHGEAVSKYFQKINKLKFFRIKVCY